MPDEELENEESLFEDVPNDEAPPLDEEFALVGNLPLALLSVDPLLEVDPLLKVLPREDDPKPLLPNFDPPVASPPSLLEPPSMLPLEGKLEPREGKLEPREGKLDPREGNLPELPRPRMDPPPVPRLPNRNPPPVLGENADFPGAFSVFLMTLRMDNLLNMTIPVSLNSVATSPLDPGRVTFRR